MVHVPPVQIRSNQRGHGLAEYCLITALVALAALGLYVHLAGGMQDLWSTANSTLATGEGTNSHTSSTAITSAEPSKK